MVFIWTPDQLLFFCFSIPFISSFLEESPDWAQGRGDNCGFRVRQNLTGQGPSWGHSELTGLLCGLLTRVLGGAGRVASAGPCLRLMTAERDSKRCRMWQTQPPWFCSFLPRLSMLTCHSFAAKAAAVASVCLGSSVSGGCCSLANRGLSNLPLVGPSLNRIQ